MTPFVVLDQEQAWNLTRYIARGPKAMSEAELRKVMATMLDIHMQLVYGLPSWATDRLDAYKEASNKRWGNRKK